MKTRKNILTLLGVLLIPTLISPSFAEIPDLNDMYGRAGSGNASATKEEDKGAAASTFSEKFGSGRMDKGAHPAVYAGTRSMGYGARLSKSDQKTEAPYGYKIENANLLGNRGMSLADIAKKGSKWGMAIGVPIGAFIGGSLGGPGGALAGAAAGAFLGGGIGARIAVEWSGATEVNTYSWTGEHRNWVRGNDSWKGWP